MTSLFDPTQAGNLHLANRIAMAPLTRNRAPGAVPTDLTATYYAQRASAGLIISEAVAISHQAQGYADVPGLYAPEQIAAWKKVTDAVHSAGGTIVAQLWHVGRISHTSLQPDGGAPVAPSPIAAQGKTVLFIDGKPTFVDTSVPRALAVGEIPGIVQDYRAATTAAIAAGFDGVEIHAANGYLIDQFLKTPANQRTDEYGGSIDNRARLLVEVVAAVSAEARAGTVGIRLSPVTQVNGIDEPAPQPLFEHVVRQLAPYDLAYVHIIEGNTGGPREVPGRPFDYAALKAAYRTAGGLAAWMVNNAYTAEAAQAAIASGAADIVAFGRPFIANPDLVERIRQGAPWAALDRYTLYGGGAKGYTDYPTL